MAKIGKKLKILLEQELVLRFDPMPRSIFLELRRNLTVQAWHLHLNRLKLMKDPMILRT
jgi:hypothetical protein